MVVLRKPREQATAQTQGSGGKYGAGLLRIETSKRGRPNTPHHPSSAGSSQKDLDSCREKEALLSLEEQAARVCEN